MLNSSKFLFVYEGGNIIYTQLHRKKQELEKQIHTLESQLKTLPNGKLICSHNGNNYKWYHSDGHQKVYIPKENQAFAEQLAAKKYLTLQLEELTNEKKAIDSYLKYHHLPPDKATRLITDNPEYAKLLSSYFKPLSDEFFDWSLDSYEHNSKFPEQLIHKSSSGHFVRSKSEALIDTLLHLNKIPFRYECALHLGDITLFPDFTIRHPATGKFFYWEHFGLMDDPHYAKNTTFKLQTYASHGIIPTLQLITTYETKNHPLSSDFIDKILHFYFF